MAATAARIGFIRVDMRRTIAGPDSDVVTRYGDAARDTPEPVETFCDDLADAATLATARLTLLSPSRRMFTLDVTEIGEAQSMDFSGAVPTGSLIDDERNFDADVLVAGIGIDLETGRSSFTVWG